jgi:hypothetical protein
MRGGESIVCYMTPESVLGAPRRKPGPQGGRPEKYPDAFIEAMLMMKVATRLSLRAVTGFARGMAQLMGKTWQIPNYSTLSRRQAHLSVDLHADMPRREGQRRVLIADATGLKLFGEGEWKVRMHGSDGRRDWRKVHILVDRQSGKIIAVRATHGAASDAHVLPELLPSDIQGDVILGDGAFHTKKLHEKIHEQGATLLTPPPRNARRWGRQISKAEPNAYRHRNAQLTRLQRRGRRRWKIESGYSQRSFVESTNHRLKSLTGDRLAARGAAQQQVEVALRCRRLNETAVPRAVAMTPSDRPAARGRTVRQLIWDNRLAA